jgi:hypothetical protein
MVYNPAKPPSDSFTQLESEKFSGPEGVVYSILFYSILFYSILFYSILLYCIRFRAFEQI